MDSRLMKSFRSSPKPLLLKDHLLDDMSSCSSNGFKSFPRRQCCTNVAFLLENNHKLAYVDYKKPPAKSALSALQSVITAVKRLPFAAAKSPEKKKANITSFLPRSFSKKLFKKGSFWKRKPEQKEIERWKSFHQLLKEDPEPSDRTYRSITTTDGNKSYSWSGSDFTVSDGGNGNGNGNCNSSSEANLNLPDQQKNDDVKMPAEEVSDNGVGVTNDDVSTESTTSTNSSTETKKQWSSDQEKEQFSPVSVLDCPFDDDDEVSSPFQHRLARMEGTRKKLLKKIQRFECLANLTSRFESQPDSDIESSDSPLPDEDEEEEEEEEEEEDKALQLFDQMKASISSHGLRLKADNLMLDFFREGLGSDKQRGESSFYEELVERAEEWIDGRKAREVFMEWDVEKNRQAYVKDMEKGGEWKKLDEENEEVVLELGNEVFAALLNEVLLDITS